MEILKNLNISLVTSFLATFCACVASTPLLGESPVQEDGGQFRSAPTVALAGGRFDVCWKDDTSHSRNLLIHFHGSPKTLKTALSRAELEVVLAVVNFSGLSSAYSKPFEADRALFGKILRLASQTVADAQQIAQSESRGGEVVGRWDHVYVSSFSAGYGAVREILKTKSQFDRVDAIVAADSIYAGLEKQADRRVSALNMRDFLRFAKLATEYKKSFLISHSQQETPYASTTETANYLLRSLGIARKPVRHLHHQAMQQGSRAEAGRFMVLGFDGKSGEDHLQHLRHIDLLWRESLQAINIEAAKR